jgi:hypothetical protein
MKSANAIHVPVTSRCRQSHATINGRRHPRPRNNIDGSADNGAGNADSGADDSAGDADSRADTRGKQRGAKQCCKDADHVTPHRNEGAKLRVP